MARSEKLVAFLGIIVTVSACAGPLILSTYGSMMGANQLWRRNAHAGVDFSETRGAPVLAAADGYVYHIINSPQGCGNGAIIRHELASPKGSHFTAYCHMEKVIVQSGFTVKRGEPIGLVGTTGNAVEVPHVHLELTSVPYSHRDGDLERTEDPLTISVGCFDPQKSYPTDKLVLTYPVRCRE